MSHEFRTPLNAILGYTQILLQGISGPLNTGQKRDLNRIDSNGRHLLDLINEILDITRIEAGRMPLNAVEFRLSDLVAEVLAELEPIISRSRLAVAADVSPRLPQLRSDRQKVKQILVNLLSNAIKFTREGSVQVRGSYNAADRTVSVAVLDTGIGIAPEDGERIFQDFGQVDSSTTRPYGGTGLGLSICRRLAHMLEGRISMESRLGEGSMFTLTLPIRLRKK
jgi:signal transduction histidine kinase